MAWLRLGKIAVMAVLAGLAVAVGAAFPGGDAEAQAYGGYTYTARVCQEYGQQPRWYNVRDGQAAYNGGNSDSGWLIVLERGVSTTYSYELAPTDGGYFLWQGNYIQISGNRWRLNAGNSFSLDTTGIYVRLYGRAGWNAGDPTPNSDFGLLSARTRYNRTTVVSGGSYIRWANMAWCR